MGKNDVKITITGDKSKLKTALTGAGGDLDSFEAKAGGWATKLGAVAIAAAAAFTAAFVGLGVGLFQLGSNFDSAYDTIRVGTGATGEALGALKDDFKAVVTNVPTDFGSAGTAIADLNTRLGLTGKPLQDMASQVLELSRLTGTDLGTNIETVTRVMGDWGISTEDAGGKLDALFRASQATGPSVDRLSALMVQFGSPLRQLGFGFDQTAALLGKFEKEGVNTELVMGSMRIALGKMAREGEPAQETLSRVTDEIKNAGSTSEANAKALELFGARAGPDMAAAIREGRFELGDLFDTVAGGTETIMGASKDTESFGEKFTKLKNKVLVGLEPLATAVFEGIGNGIQKLMPTIDTIIGGVTAFAAAFKAGGDDVTSSGFAGKLERWGLTARKVFDGVVNAVRTVGPIIAKVVGGAISKAVSILGKLAGFVQRNATVFKVLGAALLGAAAGFGALLVVAKVMQMVAAFQKVMALLNLTLAANPVILIALAIGALIGVLTAAYFKFEAFRNIVDAVGRFFRDTLWPILQAVGGFIGNVLIAVVGALAAVWTGVLWPALQAVGGFLANTVWPVLKAVGGFIGNVFVTHVKALAAIWTGVLWPALQAVAGFISDKVWPIIQAVAGFIGNVFVAHVKALTAVWTNVLWPALQRVGSFITGTVVPIIQRIASTFGTVAGTVGRWVGNIVSTVLGIGRRIGGFVSGMWNGISGGIRTASGVVSSVVGGIVNTIRGIAGRIGDIATAITSPFRSAFNSIKSLWNSTVGRVSFTIPDWVPGVGGKGFSMPKMHDGGIVPGLTGDERHVLLEAGETVRTREQEARLQEIIGGLTASADVQPVQPVNVIFQGPVTQDGKRWVMDMIEEALGAGIGSRRLRSYGGG